MSVTKADLLNSIVEKTRCTKATAEEVYDAVIDSIAAAISTGDEVDVRRLGRFTRQRVDARQGRNPRTGEAVQIPAGYRIKFKPSKSLRDRMPAA